jgi:hypothetical protein
MDGGSRCSIFQSAVMKVKLPRSLMVHLVNLEGASEMIYYGKILSTLAFSAFHIPSNPPQ